MSSSGLIYAVIVGAWAAYLVPMWLRRQDELNEARPTERFSTAIRLLSGRAAMERKIAKALDEEDEPEHAEPDEPEHAEPEPVDVRSLAVPATQIQPATASGSGSASTPAPGVKPNPKPKAKKPRKPAVNPRAKVLARRRRTTTLLFLAFTSGAIVAAVGGLALLWAPAVPAVLLTLYIAHLRAQERRRFEVKIDQRRAADAAQRLRDRPAREEPAPEPVPVPEQPAAADRRALVEQTDHAEWVDQQRAPSEDTWEVPAPRPTFATAPVTPRRPRDRSSASRGTPLFDQYSDPDRPRAANE